MPSVVFTGLIKDCIGKQPEYGLCNKCLWLSKRWYIVIGPSLFHFVKDQDGLPQTGVLMKYQINLSPQLIPLNKDRSLHILPNEN